MHSRRQTLPHPLGGTLELPCLVPSFSSRGFARVRERHGAAEYSEADIALRASLPGIGRIALVSAYDLHHELLPSGELLYEDDRVVMIDSDS